jgi:hypothetical protein
MPLENNIRGLVSVEIINETLRIVLPAFIIHFALKFHPIWNALCLQLRVQPSGGLLHVGDSTFICATPK